MRKSIVGQMKGILSDRRKMDINGRDACDILDELAYRFMVTGNPCWYDHSEAIEIIAEILRTMDKKMHQVTKRLQTAERDIKAGKPKAALGVLKKAERKNEKLVKIDRDVRDPMIDRAKKAARTGAKLPRDFGKVK